MKLCELMKVISTENLIVLQDARGGEIGCFDKDNSLLRISNNEVISVRTDKLGGIIIQIVVEKDDCFIYDPLRKHAIIINMPFMAQTNDNKLLLIQMAQSQEQIIDLIFMNTIKQWWDKYDSITVGRV